MQQEAELQPWPQLNLMTPMGLRMPCHGSHMQLRDLNWESVGTILGIAICTAT